MENREKRRYPRVQISLPIEFADLSGKDYRNVEVIDLNATGLSFASGRGFPPGVVITVTFEIPEIQKKIHTEVITRRSNRRAGEDRWITGVEFLKMNYDDFITLVDFTLAELDAT